MNNNSNKRWLAIVIAVLLIANVATLILLWSNSKGSGNKQDGPPLQGQVFDYVVKELQLNQQQQEAYAKLRIEHQQGQRLIADSIHKMKDSFFALLKDPSIPDSVVAAASHRVTEVEQQQELLTFKHFQKVRAICTPEQQQKFDNIIEEVLRRMARPRNGPPPQGKGGQGSGGMPPPPPGKNN